jgi:hypothetical protein
MILQMAVKAINNLVGPNRIIFILLVFSIYPQLTEMDPLSLSVTKRIKTIYIATKKVCHFYTER